ncbi:hypothetical protein MPH_01738 [Macrophomina phaseolina MS6]|uniref:Uncharacterized protein n=2 Tax=Macrophomina phaseolina TaxID=35725 RepID=K2SEK8_MACPH|nr:hypothetical protein MPH_01738 [Macrophomina phaseolina MS6]
MMSAALQTTLTPTPHLAVLHQQRLYILSALQRTHIVLDGARARLNTIENTLVENRRCCLATHPPTTASQPGSAYTPSRSYSSTLSSEPCHTPPDFPASHTADDQPDNRSANQIQNTQNRLSRATKKKLQHSRWRARGTLRNCVTEERALLENLHTIQRRILRLQDDALRDSTFAASELVAMTQTEFRNSPWMSGWTVEFGEKTAPLGCGFGPSEEPRKMSYGAPPGGMRGSIDATRKQSDSLNAYAWMNGSGMPHNGNTLPIINAQLIPLQQHSQLQVNTSCNPAQFVGQFQQGYPQPFIYAPAIASPLLLDPETTAEDLYDWQNGTTDATGCIDPSSVFYNLDPYHSFSYSPSGSFSSSYPIHAMRQQEDTPSLDLPEPQYITTNNDSSANEPISCTSPFPEEWDLASALRAGRSGSNSNKDKDAATSTPSRKGHGRRGHMRQLSALLSPRGSRVYHIDDLLPPSPGPRTAPLESESRKQSLAMMQDADDDDVAPGARDMGFGGWLMPTAANGHGAKGKGKGRALDPTSPTFVPGAAFFAFKMPEHGQGQDVVMGEGADEKRESLFVVAAPVDESGSSVNSSFSTADSGVQQQEQAASPASGGSVEKRRYSSAAVDLLLNRFKENAANPIKKRRSWKRGSSGGRKGYAPAGRGSLRVMGSVSEGVEEVTVMMEVV